MNPKISFWLACMLFSSLGSGFPKVQGATFEAKQVILEEHAIPYGALPEEHETHAATITEAGDGTLLAAWFAGTEENAPDIKIYLSRKPEKQSWSPPVVIDAGFDTRHGDTKEYATWNPVLFTDPKSGTVYLWYKITGTGPKPGYQNWWGAVRTSKDHGKTWSARIWLPQVDHHIPHFEPYDFYATGPVKNRPVILPDGRLLCGSSTESPLGWRTHFEIYAAGDWTGQRHGVTVIGPLEGRGIQASFIIQSADYKKIRAFTRDDGITSSQDGGETWTPIEKSPVTTSKGFHAVTTREGWHFLAFNPDRTRTPLSLARSRDGDDWEVVIPDLRSEGKKSMDYPSMMQTQDGQLHIVHTFGRDYINHLVLDSQILQD